MTKKAKIPITVLIQTKNEEMGIATCLAGLVEFDEIIVVDSNSTDRTVDIALAFGASVVNFTWDQRYPKKKQWQLDNVSVRNEWIFFLDADESPSPKLVEDIRTFLGSKVAASVAALDIQLDYVFAGRVLKHGHRVTKRCIVRSEMVFFPPVDDLGAPGMGELEGHYQPVAKGPVMRLKGRLLHNDLDPVSSWFARHNKYSDWEAYLRNRDAARESVRRQRSLQGRVFDKIPFKPGVFFVYSYLGRGGFLDGRAGFDYAFALAAYYWQIGLKTRELARIGVTDD